MHRIAFLVVLLAAPAVAPAQWEGPPTYDYDPATPGVQPPASTGPGRHLEAFEQRMVRAHQVSFSVSAPLADVQALLPPGFVAAPSGPGLDTATIIAVFVLGQRTWSAGFGTSPPYSLAFFLTNAVNTNLPSPRQELVVLAVESTSAVAVARANALYGPGIARLAELESKVESEGEGTRFKLKVKDQGLGLALSFAATCPGPIDGRTRMDPDLRIFRFVDGREARAATRQASQGDVRFATYAESGARFEAAGGYLALPGGAVKVLGFAPFTGVGFNRELEYFRATVRE